MAYQQSGYGRQYSGSGAGASSESRVPNEGPWIAFVGNLPVHLIQSDLEQIFKQQRVKSVRMLRDRESDEFRGTAFVEFLDRKSLVDALGLNGALLEDRTLRIDVADDKNKKNRSGPGSGPPGGSNDRHDGGRQNYPRPSGPFRGGGRGGYNSRDSYNDYPDNRDQAPYRGGGRGGSGYGDSGRGGGGGYRDNREGGGYGGGNGGGSYQQRGGGYNNSRGGSGAGGGRGSYGSGGRGGGGGYNSGGRGGGYNDHRGGYESHARYNDREPQEYNDIKPADGADAANRPKLNLLARSVEAPIGQLADTTTRSSIFGGGKPREAKPGDEIPATSALAGDAAAPHPPGVARQTSKQSNPDTVA